MAGGKGTKEPELPEPLDAEGVRSRAWQAYQLKMAGLDLGEIALRLSYPSAAAADKAIRDEIRNEAKMLARESRDDLLSLELDRLNYMMSRIWQQVEYGDLRAVETAMRIIAMRTKLTGLDIPDATTAQQQVLVISGAEADYIKALKSAS